MGYYRSRRMPFGPQRAASLRRHSLGVSTLNVPKHLKVYTCGDHDGEVYLIESGPIQNSRALPGWQTARANELETKILNKAKEAT
jgi:hypothetical protein